MSETIAWAAGLFEGEGCFRQNRSKQAGVTYTYPRVQLKMTDEDVVRRFAAAVGFGSVSGPHTPPSLPAGNKPHWSWAVQGVDAFKCVLEMFRPYLGVRRLARAEEILLSASGREAEGK